MRPFVCESFLNHKILAHSQATIRPLVVNKKSEKRVMLKSSTFPNRTPKILLTLDPPPTTGRNSRLPPLACSMRREFQRRHWLGFSDIIGEEAFSVGCASRDRGGTLEMLRWESRHRRESHVGITKHRSCESATGRIV